MPELQEQVEKADISKDMAQGHNASVEAWSALFDEIKSRSGRKPTADEAAKLNDMTMKGKEGVKSEPGDGKGFLHVPNPAEIFKSTNGDIHSAEKKMATN